MDTNKILFINACVREQSRTRRLADRLLSNMSGEISEVKITDIDFPKADEAFLNQRDTLIAEKAFNSPVFSCAREFASADIIVIAAPFWDLSFPSALKQYFEQININGLTFRYTEEGIPEGLCRAGKLYYITTAGGKIYSDEYGFGYVKALAQGFYGIPDIIQIKAEGLDIAGADVERILQEAFEDIDRISADTCK